MNGKKVIFQLYIIIVNERMDALNKRVKALTANIKSSEYETDLLGVLLKSS